MKRALALLLPLLASCAPDEPESPATPAAPEQPAPVAPTWAELVEAAPDPAVIPDGAWRQRIAASGLPWRVRDRGTGIELLLVPAGDYLRGSDGADEEAHADESPRHTVRIAGPFYLGRYELTVEEWRRALQTEPSHFGDTDRHPVENITYFDVRAFAEATGLRPTTEAEWEYACRAGSDAARHGPLDDVAWHAGNADYRTHPVGGKAANALGFHDMLGNVYEWTSTWYAEDFYAQCSAAGEPVDGAEEPPGGLHCVLRGGAWYGPARRVRAAARYRSTWDLAAGHVGLRVARDP